MKEIFLGRRNKRQKENQGSGEISPPAYDRLFKYLADAAGKFHTKILIFYHPKEVLRKDGTIEFIDNEGVRLFQSSAERHGIVFIDMSKTFKKMFYEKHRVPHGFMNGQLCRGHLNKYGHEAVCEEISLVIRSLSGESPCR